MVDLRSDTITKPTSEMLEVMMQAQVGDDVFNADPTVNALQVKVARMFKMEAALFCPSGTMTNQIALRIHTQPQDEVICEENSHIFLYEGGGMMYNSMISPKLIKGDRGRINAAQVSESINPEDIHRPVSKLVSLENTMNKGGGSVYDFQEIIKIRQVCDQNDLSLHLDGARLFNALVETGESREKYGEVFDTISICFSKGLGAPVGSVLLGTREKIKHAKRVRKVLGGGMRQAGYLAAACIYALDHHVERLRIDHERAKKIGIICESAGFVAEVYPVDTNIVIIKLEEGVSEKLVLEELNKKEVLAVGFGKGLVRFVTHLDFTDDHLDQFEKAFRSISL
jgi:threonine aldolase